MANSAAMEIPKAVLKRLPRYLSYLKSLPANSPENISAPVIAYAMRLGQVQVRKDLAYVTKSGKPRKGYVLRDLISDLERFLGYDHTDEALLVGAGKLGKALLGYDGFKEYGLNISIAFDKVSSSGITENGKFILPISEFPAYCKSTKARIGIICVPMDQAQNICDLMVANGIKAIMNLAPVHLSVPKDVIVQNTNLAASLALLSKELTDKGL